ncbi:hypothetical protein [Dinghuibacter silviterrae]|uniref:Capsule assembly protein Wzi n=1 Tax=Dinghuibacter silviterrae TaxID=1539049 RepID=A0A4R8DK92_9BACT|nr:hypothetical protein [Dinghuibacter silviterrae]TDW97606.1 hypothetical protein EDB95_5457 [Dinghuibacter silviterrae]
MSRCAYRCLCALILLLPFAIQVRAQSDNLTLHTKDYTLMDRLDIKLRNDSTLAFSTVKPFNRKTFTERIAYIDSLDAAGQLPIKLSAVDRYDIRCFLMENNEYAPARYLDSFRLKHPILKTFYETPSHLYAVDTKDFTMRVDPVLNLQTGHANDGTGSTYLNTRGLYVRGMLAKKVGFYTYISDNQERDPLYVRQWVSAHNAVPGVGFYKPYGTNGYDYFDFRGGVSFDLIKVIHVQYAYDKLFIGNGFRSLELSDFANDYVFLRLNTRIWKIDYEMIIAQTMQSVPQVGRDMKPKNYMSIHHLSAQLAKWLNIGLYENIMESGAYGLQLSYLNPVIFYRATESNLGTSGKANIAFDAKSNIGHHVQLYGTLLFDEFQIHELLHYSDGSFTNKQALQGGIKYIDALGIKNLDLQGEVNLIRPFTYMNFDSTTNFTHYNQPLAHPNGANIREFVALARYQPIPRLYVSGKIIQYLQGLDSAGYNMGNNLFDTYNTRPRDYGWHIGTGIPVHSTTLGLNISWELFDNAYIEVGGTHRTYNVQGQPNAGVTFYSVGFRMNIGRREFDF